LWADLSAAGGADRAARGSSQPKAKTDLAYGFGPMFDLPNFAFSVPLAKFFLVGEGDHAESAEWLERALLLYPMMLKPLLAKCNVRLSEKYARAHTHTSHTSHTPHTPHTPVCG
jgi:hypothetical protein